MATMCKWCRQIGRLCLWPWCLLMSLLNLLFLPDSARAWIFGTGTRGFELLNAILLLGWAVVMLHDDGSIYLMPSYAKFAAMPAGLVFTSFAGIGLLLLIFLPSESPRSNILSGFLLVAASMLWALLAVGFAYGYPPLTPAMIVYPVQAVVSLWAGAHLIDGAKEQLIDGAKKKTEKARGG